MVVGDAELGVGESERANNTGTAERAALIIGAASLWSRKPAPNRVGRTSVRSGPLMRPVRAGFMASSPINRTPSTSPIVAAYVRASERTFGMPLAPGISVAWTARVSKRLSPAVGDAGPDVDPFGASTWRLNEAPSSPCSSKFRANASVTACERVGDGSEPVVDRTAHSHRIRHRHLLVIVGFRFGNPEIAAAADRRTRGAGHRRETASMATDLTGDTVELLQTLIRNACVNDGTVESGFETRNADVLQNYVERTGVDVDRWEPTPGRASFVARLPGSDPTALSLCLMGHTDVVPVNPDGWREDPFGGELIRDADGNDEVWGRGAIDMLDLTASMAVVFRSLVDRGFRPRGDLLYFAVADEEAGSKYGARWVADEHPDAIRCDYLLTENGGLHMGGDEHRVISVNVAEKGVAWRRLRVRGTPGHGSMPFGADNALITAAKVVSRLADYRPTPRFHELWRGQVDALGLPDDMKAAMLDEATIDDLLADLPHPGAKGHFHACTHTTFAPNVIATKGRPKTNVIPDVVELDIDIRTMPGDHTDEVTGHLRAALGDELFDRVEVEVVMDDPASTSRIDTPLWDALQRAVAVPFPDARLNPQFVVGFTDARIFRELGAVSYGAGLLSPTVDPSEFALRFHGHNERIDVESLRLTTQLWERVVVDLLG